MSVNKKAKLSILGILGLRETYLLTDILRGLYCTFVVGSKLPEFSVLLEFDS